MPNLRSASGLVHRTLQRAVADDVSNVAQSAAYSAIFALFPALLVLAALLPLLPEATPLRQEAALLLRRVLPGDVVPMLAAYFTPARASAFASKRALLLAGLLSLYGCSGVLTTVMEGLRRAWGLPEDCWHSWWRRRLRAATLVPLALLPFAVSSLLVVFGHFLAVGFGARVVPWLRPQLVFLAELLRWGLALAASVSLIAVLYKLGIPLRQRWRETLPGAAIATAMWLVVTLGFGVYVTDFANYSKVYGSLGAGVALLVWLFLTVLSVLIGAEFNGQLRAARDHRPRPMVSPAVPDAVPVAAPLCPQPQPESTPSKPAHSPS